MEIRTLTRNNDFKDLITLSRDFFHEYEAYHSDFFKIDQLKDEHVTSYFLSFCDTPSRRVFIAVDGENIVGYITAYIQDQPDYWQVKQVGEISGFMVQKEFRHKGIGRDLLNEAKHFLDTQGVTYYRVYTSVENHTALDFYERHDLNPLYITLLGSV